MNKFLLILLISINIFAEDICREVEVNLQEETVCFPYEKVCKYFNYHDMAPTLTYDCWSTVEGDKNALNRIGCSNGNEAWPRCAGGYIL